MSSRYFEEYYLNSNFMASLSAAVIRGDAIPFDGIPGSTYFRDVQRTGIEAVFASVLIALLTTPLSFYFPTGRWLLFLIYKEKIAGKLKMGKGSMSHFIRGFGG